jgi:hypothetical protein
MTVVNVHWLPPTDVDLLSQYQREPCDLSADNGPRISDFSPLSCRSSSLLASSILTNFLPLWLSLSTEYFVKRPMCSRRCATLCFMRPLSLSSPCVRDDARLCASCDHCLCPPHVFETMRDFVLHASIVFVLPMCLRRCATLCFMRPLLLQLCGSRPSVSTAPRASSCELDLFLFTHFIALLA